MRNINWSEAPDWATCVVKPKIKELSDDYHWSEEPRASAHMMRIETGIEFTMNSENFWEIVEKRPVGSPRDVMVTRVNDDKLAIHGYSIRTNDEITKYKQQSLADLHLAHLFTPVQQPSTASDLLKQAEQLLTERGKQYDTSGQERSSAKIVAAFNTITGRDLTSGEGWLFLMLLKAVRFYSNTETPHRDSLEDLISYAALHAEEYLNDER